MTAAARLCPDPAQLALAEGLLAGAVVLTLRGEVAVAALVPGDRVITRDAGAVTLRGAEARTTRAAPVRVRAGSLGHKRPEADALLAPGTRLLLRDWRARTLYGQAQALVPAQRLVDGEFVTEELPRALVLHRIDLGGPHVIYADGLEVAV
jgi:hypothetical protein